MKTTHKATHTFYGFRVATSRTDDGGTETTVSHPVAVDVLFRYYTRRSRIHAQQRLAVEWTELWETRSPGNDFDDSADFKSFVGVEPTSNNWDYDYLGYGLRLSFGGGKTVFLQGEEAADLYDQLESCEDAAQIVEMMAVYEEFAEIDE